MITLMAFILQMWEPSGNTNEIWKCRPDQWEEGKKGYLFRRVNFFDVKFPMARPSLGLDFWFIRDLWWGANLMGLCLYPHSRLIIPIMIVNVLLDKIFWESCMLFWLAECVQAKTICRDQLTHGKHIKTSIPAALWEFMHLQTTANMNENLELFW